MCSVFAVLIFPLSDTASWCGCVNCSDISLSLFLSVCLSLSFSLFRSHLSALSALHSIVYSPSQMFSNIHILPSNVIRDNVQVLRCFQSFVHLCNFHSYPTSSYPKSSLSFSPFSTSEVCPPYNMFFFLQTFSTAQTKCSWVWACNFLMHFQLFVQPSILFYHTFHITKASLPLPIPCLCRSPDGFPPYFLTSPSHKPDILRMSMQGFLCVSNCLSTPTPFPPHQHQIIFLSLTPFPAMQFVHLPVPMVSHFSIRPPGMDCYYWCGGY